MNITLQNISKSFIINKNSFKEVLKDISYTFLDNTIYFLVGPSGSGKSTLLSIIGSLDKPTSGEVLYDNNKIENRSNFIATHISFVFQEYNLFENLSVYDNLKIFLNDKNKLQEYLKQFNCEFSLNSKVKYLSGGERQRLSILRSYLKGGDIFLLDEPTGNLDNLNSHQIMDLVCSISKNKIVIVVSHDMALANEYADKILRLEDGKIIEELDNLDDIVLDYKNKGIDANNNLINRIYNLGSISIEYNNEQLLLTTTNCLSILNKIYETNKNKTVPIKINKTNNKLNENIYIKPEDHKNSFLFKYGVKNIASKMIRTIGSFISLIFCFTIIFCGFNFYLYDVGYYTNYNLNNSGIYYPQIVGQDPMGYQYFKGSDYHQTISDLLNKNDYYDMFDNISITYNNEYYNIDLILLKDKTTFTYEGQEYVINPNKVIVQDFLKNQGVFLNNRLNLYNNLSIDIDSENTIKTDIYKRNVDEGLYAFASYDYIFSTLVSYYKNIYLLSGQTFFEDIKDNSILGVSPNSILENEIYINQYVLETYFDNDESQVINKTFTIKSLQELGIEYKYNNSVSFDLTNYFSQITVKGVIDDEQTMSAFYINENIFNALKTKYIENEVFSKAISSHNCGKIANILYNNDFKFYSEAITPIYVFKEGLIYQFNALFLVLSLILLFVSFSLLMLWISIIIKDKYKEIAVMKCLGFNNKSIFLAFLSTIILISLISTIGGLCLGFVLTASINNIMSANIMMGGFSGLIYDYNIYSIIICILHFILIPFVMAFLSIHKINKIEPFAAIKEFK